MKTTDTYLVLGTLKDLAVSSACSAKATSKNINIANTRRKRCAFEHEAVAYMACADIIGALMSLPVFDHCVAG